MFCYFLRSLLWHFVTSSSSSSLWSYNILCVHILELQQYSNKFTQNDNSKRPNNIFKNPAVYLAKNGFHV